MAEASQGPGGRALVEAESTDGALAIARALAQRLARLRSQGENPVELRVARALALNVIDLLEALLEAHGATGGAIGPDGSCAIDVVPR